MLDRFKTAEIIRTAGVQNIIDEQGSPILDANDIPYRTQTGGKVVVIGEDQVKDKFGNIKSDYLIAAVKGIWEKDLPAELTFRINEEYLKEALKELISYRNTLFKNGKKVALGMGSIVNFSELEKAIDWNVDFVVSPGSGVASSRRSGSFIKGITNKILSLYTDPQEFIDLAHKQGIYAAPAAETPNEIMRYLFPDDVNDRPDALKIFDSQLITPKILRSTLLPFVRKYGQNSTIGYPLMNTGGVNVSTGPEYEEVLRELGFYPTPGMSDPIGIMKNKATSNFMDYANVVETFMKAYVINYATYLKKLQEKK